MSQKKRDIEFGDAKEIEHWEAISCALDCSLNRVANKYALFDYEGEGVKAELKSRRNYKYTYPTTMVSANKVDEAYANTNTEHYFCFSFTDKLCYIKYDKERFANYTRQRGGRCDRGYAEIKDYVFIPVRDLTDVKSH